MSRIRRWVNISGMLGPVIMGLAMLISALAYVGIDGQRYSLMNHFVSELGEIGVSALAGVFNGGLFLGGAVTAIFMAHLARQVGGWKRYPLGVLGVAAALSGALVGVFPMNHLQPHIVAAMSFFNLGMLTSFLYSFLFLFDKRRTFPRWLAIPGLLNGAAFALFLNFPASADATADFQQGMSGFLTNRPDFMAVALLEWVVVLGIMIWVFLLGVSLHWLNHQN